MSDWSWRSLTSRSAHESPRDLQAFSNPQDMGKVSLDFGVRRRKRSPTASEKVPLDIVQFSAPIFFLDEAEGKVSIDIMRLGDLKGSVSVSYNTIDGSARSGEKYHATQGVVVFLEGEYMKTITVTCISDDFFAPTLEFKIKIYAPVNCELGMYLHTCIVKIIDDDPFPSSKYKTDLDAGEEGSTRIPALGLFWEYVKLNFHSADVARSSVLVLFLDQIENVYNFFTIWAGMYLVDTLFQLHDPQSASQLLMPSRVETAVLIGVCYVAPLCVLHGWSLCKVHLDVEGQSCAFLQQVLLRKYLNFSEASRCTVTSSDLLVSAIDDASDLAAAYTSVLALVKLCGKLVVLLYFVSNENPKALGIAMIMPVVMLVFAFLRFHSIEQVSAAVGEREVEVISLTDETCNRYRLVADYARRPKMSNKFFRRIRALQRAKLAEERVATTNRYVPVWVGAIFIGSYVATSSSLVLNGTLTLGRFMATIGIFEKISGDFSELYQMVMQFSKVIEPLKGLTGLLNLETDLQCWKNNRRHSRDITAAKLEKLYNAAASAGKRVPCAPDLLEIELQDVSFEYQSKDASSDARGLVLRNAIISVPQGKLVALAGDQRAGRTTFLQCLGRVIFPTAGQIFIPSHLRVLHVTQEPALMNLSLFENLTFGCIGPSTTSDYQRIREILRGLQMPEVLEVLDLELRQNWHQRVTTPKKEVSAAASSRRGSSLWKVFQAQQLTAGGYFSSALADSSDSDKDECSESQTAETMDGQETGVTVWANEADDEGGDGSEGLGESRQPPSKWQEAMTYTDKAKIHLARALIVNAEVMILQRPPYHYNHQRDAQDIIEVLKEHTRNRGYKLPQETLVRRRPRTVFFSPEEVVEQAAAADEVWHLDGTTHMLTSVAEVGTLSNDFTLPALAAQGDMQPEQEPGDPQLKFRFVSF